MPQSPPVPILSGEKDSRVGVGQYELATAAAATRPCPRAAAFGKAKARGVEARPVAAPGQPFAHTSSIELLGQCLFEQLQCAALLAGSLIM